MQKLARFLPVEAIANLVGLEPDGREQMLEWAAAAFNAIGPVQDPNDVESMKAAFAYMIERSTRAGFATEAGRVSCSRRRARAAFPPSKRWGRSAPM